MPRWSDDILNELRRVLRRMGYSGTQVQRRIDAMGGAFEDAFVSGYEGLIPAMTNDAKDSFP